MTFDGIDEKDWLEELSECKLANTRHALAAFALLGLPETLLDVGCGDGTMVRTARALGIEAFGVDQLVNDWGEWFYQHNLVNAFSIGKPCQQVWCLEVAEHIDPSAHATLCDTLNDNLEDHGLLLFSAAHPNQGGMGHVAERPSKYWLDQFALRGLSYQRELTVRLCLLWSNMDSPLYWLASNVLIFNK